MPLVPIVSRLHLTLGPISTLPRLLALPTLPGFVVAALLAYLPLAAGAEDIDRLQLLNQGEFRRLSEDLGAAASFKPLIPSEPLGLTGFDIGVAITGTRLRNRALFERASSGSDVPIVLPIPSIRLHKGLPHGVDIGVTYSTVPSSNIALFGGELRWAFIEGGVAIPAVAVRGSVSRLTGVDQLKLQTTALDLSVSKGILNITPYAGIGKVWTSSTPRGVPGLREESFSQNKLFAGVNVNLGVNFAFEIDRTGGATSYGVKGGIRF